LEVLYRDDPETVVTDELSVCRARARVDVAVVNGHLGAFEIKSEADRLDRLPRQARIYDKVFDTVTVVCAPCHADRAESLAPDWYGIWVAEGIDDRLTLHEHRPGAMNPHPSAFAVAQLLWREEMVGILERENGSILGLARTPRRDLIPALLKAVPQAELAAEVRACVRARIRSGLI
jgi:hypothetical protein